MAHYMLIELNIAITLAELQFSNVTLLHGYENCLSFVLINSNLAYITVIIIIYIHRNHYIEITDK